MVGYTNSGGKCVFMSNSTVPFTLSDTLAVVVSDPTGVLQSSTVSQGISIYATSLTVQIKKEYIFKVQLIDSIGGSNIPGLLVHAVSISYTDNLYTGADGCVVFRASNKNFDLNTVFTLTITDASGNF